jgi:preprotein translocase subunit YajC
LSYVHRARQDSSQAGLSACPFHPRNLAAPDSSPPEDSNVLASLLFTPAHAQTSMPGGSDLMAFLPMVAIFVVFYFLLIRPQQKRAKEQKAMLGALQKGDEVVTAGGIVGKIGKLTDQYATLEVAPGVEMTVQRQSVAQLLPKGTIKAL